MNPVMGPATTGPVDYIGASIDSDVVLWEGAIRANGGSISDDDLRLASAFVTAERAAGTYDLTDDYWPLWLPTEVAARTSLKQRRLMTMTGSPAHTADRGYAFDGSTQFGDTGFIPSTHAVAVTQANNRIAVYERTNVTGNTNAAGAASASFRNFLIRPRSSGNAIVGNNVGTTSTFTLPAADSRGFTAGSRNADTAASSVAYKNGVAMTRTGDPANFSASGLPLVSVYLGGVNLAGVLTLPRACSLGFACVGATLTAAQELAQYINVQAWATAKGAQV